MKKIIIKLTVVAFLGATLFTACKSSQVQEKGKLITYDELLSIAGDSTNNNKRFTVVGYPTILASYSTVENNKVTVLIYEKPEGSGLRIGSARILFSDRKEKNSCYVPSTFTPRDILIYDNEGLEHHYDEKLQFSFTLKLTTNDVMRPYLSSDKSLKKAYLYDMENVRIDKN
jgi:hypothetical protein